MVVVRWGYIYFAALAGGLLLTWLGFTQLFILMAAIQILSTLVILKLQLE